MRGLNKRGASGRRIMLILSVLLMVLTSLSAGAAEVSFKYPKASTKKGLYVTPGMEEDALELGIRHATINLCVSDFMPEPSLQNSIHCYPFDFGGKTYWFAKGAIAQYDRELSRLAQGNVLVTAILLLSYRSDLKSLIYPAARKKSANYYQWNMTDEAAVNTLRAIITFFQRRYSNKSGPRIVGWIVGNEVNNAGIWNWCGDIELDTYVDLYAAQCAAVYQAARSVYANARIYMCLDHYWNEGNGASWYAGKAFLTRFASRMSARGIGNGKWHIAYHPYNVDLTSADIMAASPAVTNSPDTRIVTMKNLSALTNFVKANYSKKCRVILSEQGYSSVTGGKKSSGAQAKNIALAYYIAEHNSMVDALILHRQVDHTAEVAAGAAFGLYTSWGGENAAKRKPAWLTYKLADTTKTNKYTKAAARQASRVTGSSVKKIFTAQAGMLRQTASLAWSRNYTGGGSGYGALSGFLWQDGAYRLIHDQARNANVPWGLKRSGKVNCKKKIRLGFGIRVNGSTSGNCTVTVRLWSGTKRYYEAKKVITCGVPNGLYMNLKKWKYRNKITRIDILVTPNGGGWSANADAVIWSIGTAS